MQGVDRGFDHVGGSVEVGLPNLEVDDAAALTLEGAGFIQNLEGGLGAQPGHAAGKLQFVLRGFCHGDEGS
jgi:hypothetical protein